MWTNRDYENLQPFYEWLDQHSSAQLYGGTEFEEDQDTQDGLLDWFFWRKVIDNRKFGAYFRRVLNIYARQYYQLLRVETTEIDPLVGNYLERQILRKGSRAETGNENTTERGTNNNKTTSKGSNTGNTETTTEGTANGTGTSDATTTENGATTGHSKTDTKAKHGETPQAAVGSGDSMALDWTYLSSQDETESVNDTSGTTNGSTNTKGKTTDDSKTTGHAVTKTTDNSNGEVVNDGSNSKTVKGETQRNENTADDTRERLTGRQEAPQDMLGRARDYITQTNAFLWLVDKLDACFMQVFDL